MAEELLAFLVEQIDDLRQMYIATHGGKARKKAFAIPRPWHKEVPAKPKRKPRVEDVARAFGMTLPPMEERPKKLKR